jgi:hypothetical protein
MEKVCRIPCDQEKCGGYLFVVESIFKEEDKLLSQRMYKCNKCGTEESGKELKERYCSLG